jgi:Carboxypeptidase regulatory-like domain
MKHPITGREGLNKTRATQTLFRSLFLPLALATSLLWSCSSSRESETELRASHSKLKSQWFLIDTDSSTVIKGESGLIVAIPPGAFVDSAGNRISGKLYARLREANTMPMILAAGLETRSGNKLLATNGMYCIEVWENGKNVRIDPSSGLYAYFPTNKKDPAMGLYAGEYSYDKMDWKLLASAESSIPNCGSGDDAKTKKKCKRCEYLVNKMAKVKTGKRPKADEWVDRYYWENGVMYLYSSGDATPMLTQKELDECKDWLENSARGRDLLAKVEQVKLEQKENVGDYYAYRLKGLGWHNIDKLVKDELITFNGLVTGRDGNPVSGAQVHLLCAEPNTQVHTYTTASDGTFSLEFVPGKDFTLYAYQKDQVGKAEVRLTKGGNDISRVRIDVIGDGEMDEFMKALL